jgi:hypothetical protein
MKKPKRIFKIQLYGGDFCSIDLKVVMTISNLHNKSDGKGNCFVCGLGRRNFIARWWGNASSYTVSNIATPQQYIDCVEAWEKYKEWEDR